MIRRIVMGWALILGALGHAILLGIVACARRAWMRLDGWGIPR